MSTTMTQTDCWMRGDVRVRCVKARRGAPPRHDLRARLVAYALAAVGLALAAYGERYVLAEAPAPLVESAIASCAAELVAGTQPFTPACIAQDATAPKGAAI